MENRLIALGGKLKDGRIYLTGFWRELFKVKISVKYCCGNQRLTSMTINGKELLKYGDDPKANERTRRNALKFIKSMAYAYYDIEEGAFKCIDGAFVVFVERFNTLSVVFGNRFYDIKL